jgi:DNA polymerase-3 subunit chi
MTKVDFYILPSADPSRAWICLQAHRKAWRMGHRIYLHCSDASQRDDLDARLWAFKGESLRAPRPCRKRTGQPDRPGLGEDCGQHQDLLVNLDLKVPAFASALPAWQKWWWKTR